MTHGSLFSGIGGFDLAAEWAGWDNKFHCEWNDFGQKILKYYWPQAESYGDITKTDFRKWRGQIDVLTGGFPCQPFSQAGKRAGAEDDRYLWPEMLRAIEEIRPTWVVGENVAGITTMVQPYTETKVESQASIFEASTNIITEEAEFVVETVCSDLERIGYAVQPIIIPACAVSAPHRRDRVWFVAKNTKCDGRLCGEFEQEGAENGKFGDFSTRDCNRICEQKNAGITSDSYSKRQQTGCELQESSKKEQFTRFNSKDTCSRTITDSESTRKQGQCQCEHGDDTYSDSTRLQGSKKRGSLRESREKSNQQPTRFFCTNWQDFPTQPPVCGGNDGLSRELDGITFPKWRAESIKAYGNAIVPQVAYQIFEAINQFELK